DGDLILAQPGAYSLAHARYHHTLQRPETSGQQQRHGNKEPQERPGGEAHVHLLDADFIRPAASSGMKNSTSAPCASDTVTLRRKNPAALCQATTVYTPGGTSDRTNRPDSAAIAARELGLTKITPAMLGCRRQFTY